MHNVKNLLARLRFFTRSTSVRAFCEKHARDLKVFHKSHVGGAPNGDATTATRPTRPVRS
jgi:hypothetical protein